MSQFLESMIRFNELLLESGKMSSDSLQNEILLILHHVGDAEKALTKKDLGYIENSLKDIRESAMRLSKFVPSNLRKDLDRATSED